MNNSDVKFTGTNAHSLCKTLFPSLLSRSNNVPTEWEEEEEKEEEVSNVDDDDDDDDDDDVLVVGVAATLLVLFCGERA